VRENRRILAHTQPRDAYDYRFHSLFQRDFYESVITPKSKPVVNSQWIDLAYIESKYDPIFDSVVVTCKAKHLRDILAFKKNWNNEVIAQFYATVYFEEYGDTRKPHWMIEDQWYEVSYAQFARLLGFGRKDASRPRIHLTLKLEARKIKFMYPRNKQVNFGETTDMLPFYAYLNRLFRRTVTPREGDGTKILAYNKNILAAMAKNANEFEFFIFDFIWEEIKAISENPLKSYGYAPYLMHIIERVIAHIFFCEKEHHPLRIKNDLRASVEDTRAAAPYSSPPRAARGRGQQRDKPLSPIQKIFSLLFGICKSQHAADVKAQHERCERKKIIKSVKEIRAHMNLQPPSSPIASEGEESLKIESFEERIAQFEDEISVQQWYGDASFSGFSFNYGSMASTSFSHPPPFDSPPPTQTHNDDEEEDDGDE
jgi:hypothetical protein